MIRSKKVKDSARGEDCALRLVGICSFNPEQTVLCHVGKMGGRGFKCDDTFSVYGCFNCHQEIDGVNRRELAGDILRAVEETQHKLIEKGLINVI